MRSHSSTATVIGVKPYVQTFMLVGSKYILPWHDDAVDNQTRRLDGTSMYTSNTEWCSNWLLETHIRSLLRKRTSVFSAKIGRWWRYQSGIWLELTPPPNSGIGERSIKWLKRYNKSYLPRLNKWTNGIKFTQVPASRNKVNHWMSQGHNEQLVRKSLSVRQHVREVLEPRVQRCWQISARSARDI